MYNGGMAGFGFIFMLIYLGVIAYFFYLFASIAKSLEKIAEKNSNYWFSLSLYSRILFQFAILVTNVPIALPQR